MSAWVSLSVCMHVCTIDLLINKPPTDWRRQLGRQWINCVVSDYDVTGKNSREDYICESEWLEEVKLQFIKKVKTIIFDLYSSLDGTLKIGIESWKRIWQHKFGLHSAWRGRLRREWLGWRGCAQQRFPAQMNMHTGTYICVCAFKYACFNACEYVYVHMLNLCFWTLI